MSSSAVFALPLRNGEDFISLNLDSDDFSHVLDVLQTERVPPSAWHDIALAYHRKGYTQRSRDVVKIACERFERDSPVSARDMAPLLTMRGSDFLMQASAMGDSDARRQLLDSALSLFKSATKLDIDYYLGGVMSYFPRLFSGTDIWAVQSEFEESRIAEVQFLFLLYRAIAFYGDGKYVDALGEFGQMLTRFMNCPFEIRIGIGYCQLALGNVTRAIEAFTSVTTYAVKKSRQLRPMYGGYGSSTTSSHTQRLLEQTLCESHVGTALCYFQTDIVDNRVAKGLSEIEAALAINPKHPIALSIMAEYLYWNDNQEGAVRAATAAFATASTRELQADAACLVARCMHRAGSTSEAMHHYQTALQLNPGNVLARLGRAQVLIGQNNLADAIAELERVGAGGDTNRLLGYCYARKGEVDKARDAYRDVVSKYRGEDADLLMDYAMLVVSSDPKEALRCYNDAVSVMKKKGMTLNATMNTNHGALLFFDRKYSEALTSFQRALELFLSSSTSADKSVPAAYYFNVARAMEATGQLEEAKKSYLQLLEKYPAYLPPLIRLAEIARRKDNDEEAYTWLHLAVELHPKDRVPSYILGLSYLADRRFGQAQSIFEAIMKYDRSDVVALLGLAHMYYLYACSDAETPERVQKYLSHAAEFFEKALRFMQNNVYAAVGIGALMGERGYLEDAKTVLSRIRESGADVPVVLTLDMAHVALATKQHGAAISLYQAALQDCERIAAETPKADAAEAVSIHSPAFSTRLCLARALYENRAFEQAASILSAVTNQLSKDGTTSTPSGSGFHLFVLDHALVLQRHAAHALEGDRRYMSANRARDCIRRLEDAEEILSRLDWTQKKYERLVERVKTLKDDIAQTMVRAREVLDNATSQEEKEQQQRNEQVAASAAASSAAATANIATQSVSAEVAARLAEMKAEAIRALQDMRSRPSRDVADEEGAASGGEEKEVVTKSTRGSAKKNRKRSVAEGETAEGEASDAEKEKESERPKAKRQRKTKTKKARTVESDDESAGEKVSESEESDKDDSAELDNAKASHPEVFEAMDTVIETCEDLGSLTKKELFGEVRRAVGAEAVNRIKPLLERYMIEKMLAEANKRDSAPADATQE